MTDAESETRKHIKQVQLLMIRFANDILDRAQVHDASKLESPEKELFDEHTHKLSAVTFGSPEYKKLLEDLKPALDHHYARNPHHPEWHKAGISGMTLVDLMELIADWRSAVMRHSNGNVLRSIEINQERFGYSDELKQALINTVKEYFP